MRPFGCRDSANWLLHSRKSYSNLAAPTLPPWQLYSYTYSTLLLVYLTAVAVPNVYRPLQLLGATAVTAIVSFLPAVLQLSLQGWRLTWHSLAAGLLLVVGLVQSAAGITSAVLAAGD